MTSGNPEQRGKELVNEPEVIEEPEVVDEESEVSESPSENSSE